MTQSEMLHFENRIRELFEHHIQELKKDFVSKEEFKNVKSLAEKHEKLYNRAVGLLVYIGIMSTLQFLFGQRVIEFFKWVSK